MNKKLFIVCLIILALLFFAGLGTGFMLNTGKRPDPADFNPGNWPWLQAMDSLLPSSGTPLDRNRLKPGSGCQRSGNAFLLNKNSPSCEIEIRPIGSAKPEDYQQATLRLQGQGTQVDVIYRPQGEKKKTVSWPSTDPIRLVVFENGGILDLECMNCENTGRTVRIEIGE